MKTNTLLAFFKHYLIGMLFLTSAYATDGVFEINHTCAVQLGCSSGDSLGYPISINDEGSYRLTSNLVIPDVSTRGIFIAQSNVNIDLNGFSIIRSGCVNASSNCTAVGNGMGITSLSTLANVTVSNGSIVGMGGNGIGLIGVINTTVTKVNVHWNGGNGIITGDYAHIVNNLVFQNSKKGIKTRHYSKVSGNNSSENGDEGIHAEDASIISSNITNSNGLGGIRAREMSSIKGNLMSNNTGSGLVLSSGSTSNYRDNTIINNVAGTVSGGFNMGNNFCNTNEVCP